MYKNIIFDMDGTLVNTYEGIYNSYKHAIEKIGMKFEGDLFVGKVIGAPLKDVFCNTLGLGESEALKAVEIYRSYYQEKGKNEACLYDGIKEALKELKSNGYFLGVATLKKEDFAKEILANLKMIDLFDVVYGIDKNDTLTKADLIKKCIEYVGVTNDESILVGDSEYDLLGAQEVGIDFMAVTYGFGFKEISRCKGITHISNTCDEIVKNLENK